MVSHYIVTLNRGDILSPISWRSVFEYSLRAVYPPGSSWRCRYPSASHVSPFLIHGSRIFEDITRLFSSGPVRQNQRAPRGAAPGQPTRVTQSVLSTFNVTSLDLKYLQAASPGAYDFSYGSDVWVLVVGLACGNNHKLEWIVNVRLPGFSSAG